MGKGKGKGKRAGKARRKPAAVGRRESKAKPQAPPLAASIFTVTNGDLARLIPEYAVELIRDLLWAEARRIGLPVTRVHISTRTDVPDGGIDATIEENASLIQSDLIKIGHMGFQIKAGGTFQPWQASQIKRILFGEKNAPNRENLGASVKFCLEKNGTYVLVCTNIDPTPPQREQAVSHIKTYLGQCGYKNAKVDMWAQSHLIGLLERFPSLSLRVNGRGGLRFQTHTSWSIQDDMRKSFKAGEEQLKFISAVQTELRRHDRAVHIRVWGEAGIGKTRLVLEATRGEDLKALVIYCDSATKFRDSDLMNEILRDDNQFAAILVVDECDPDSRSYIWNKLTNHGTRIKLISIHNELDRTTGDISYIDAPLLANEQIVQIIQEYGVPGEQAQRWPAYCGGSPRVAHVVGLNLKNNPDDLLRPPDTVNVWDRFIVGGDDPSSDGVRQRRLVLRHLALFKRFGYGGRLAEEAKAIGRTAHEADPSITWARFQEIVKELRSRKILQGETTLYITPKLLHIKLWTEWWEVHGVAFDIRRFSAGLPESLLGWFHEMFRYAAESQVAQRIVNELLDERGVFQTGGYLEDPRGARYFLGLSEANPEAALRCVKNTIGTWSTERLSTFSIGRREVVWALERIAVWRELFPDAARLLLRLGEAENETWGNNASGVFAGLFSPGPGRVAPTEASPAERFPVLKEALESESKAQRLLALRACDSALESQSFVRASGAEHQGLRREPDLWKPQTWGDLFDAYRRVWGLLWERLDSLEQEEREKAIDILLRNAGGLARYGNLFDMVIDTLSALAEKPYADKKKIIEAVERILHYRRKELSPDMRNRWLQLRSRLVGRDFHSLMERYVGMDLFEDRIDEEGELTDRVEAQVAKLAAQAVHNPELLEPELRWLVTDAAKNGFRFGYALGTKDEDFGRLPRLLDAQRNAGSTGRAYFLGGYFRAIHERDLGRWEALLDELSLDDTLRIWVPELTWRSGLTDRAALRILNLAKRGAVDVSHFQMFGFGSAIADVSEDIINQWTEFLLDSGTREGVSIALDLHHFYYCRKESKRTLPKELTLRLLIAEPLFRKAEERRRSQMEEYHWTELGREFVRRYPREALALADAMLEHFGEDGTIVEGYHSSTQEVLDEIAKQLPGEVWQRITQYLGPPVDGRAYRITQWLRGGEFAAGGERGVLPLIPVEDIWQWVDQDVENRAWYLASFVPKALFRKEAEVCVAREVLVRYGGEEDVRRNLMANFSTEGWTGPESVHLQGKKQWLLDFRKDETNENVKRCIDEYVASIERDIERARIEEERRH